MKEGQQQDKDQCARCQRETEHLGDRARKSMSRNHCRTPMDAFLSGLDCTLHMVFRGGTYDGAAAIYFEGLPAHLLQLVEARLSEIRSRRIVAKGAPARLMVQPN